MSGEGIGAGGSGGNCFFLNQARVCGAQSRPPSELRATQDWGVVKKTAELRDSRRVSRDALFFALPLVFMVCFMIDRV